MQSTQASIRSTNPVMDFSIGYGKPAPAFGDDAGGGGSEPRSIDEIITDAIGLCEKLPIEFSRYRGQIAELRSRLAHGRLHLAVIGEFNRGKSTFINSLTGINVLPTSVLPITSVPTEILYGTTISCTIEFLRDKPSIVVTNSPEAVVGALLNYVVEKNNPNNQYGVATVRVTLPSPLLENGTVLIDTPGFGSTYLHNTQTTLAKLADCDAALFLLSADPPVTQTEIEFLKQVIIHVPRIFFILNKTDLIAGKELESVDEFIKEVISDKSGLREKPHIFHISARYAGFAKEQSPNDRFWARSGMEEVRNDIVRFMAHEKYFLLSQALNDKLKGAVNGILLALNKDKNSLLAPVAGIRTELDAIINESEAVTKALERERAMSLAEKKAIVKFFDEKLSVGRLKLIRRIHEAADGLINSSSCSAESLKSVSTALERIIPEALYAFKIQTTSDLGKPFKKAALLHGKQYISMLESVHACLAGVTGTLPENRLPEKLDALEFEFDERSEHAREKFSLQIKASAGDFFFARSGKVRRLHARYDHIIDELIKRDLFSFSQNTKSLIDSKFAVLGEYLTLEYRNLSAQLDEVINRKELAVAEYQAKNAEPLARLDRQIQSFEGILKSLH